MLDEKEKIIEKMELRKVKRERKIKNKTTNQILNFNLNKIEPLTENQKLTFESYEKGKHLLLIGSSGTGKTYISLYLSIKEILETKQYKNLIIIRSVVPSRDMGFLPGNVKEKIKAFELPYQQIFSDLFKRDDSYDYLKNKKMVDFISTSFLRGITFEDSIIVVDECQNLELNELYAIITRIGKNSKVIFCGDYKQSDIKQAFKMDTKKEDILKFIEIIEHVSQFKIIKYGHDDIIRSKLVKEFIIASEKLGYV
jgi:phosphate starvation-inducible protein PhoH